MIRMNNKGQVLVAFILMIPVLILMSIAIIDVGFINIEYRRVDNTVRNSVKYGINNLDKDNVEDTMRSLIMDNLKNVDSITVDVDIDNNYAKASVLVKYKGLISITNRDITSSYYANINNNKININKER